MDVEDIQHCGDCQHWHRQPNMDLSQIRGECREGPPQASALYTIQGGGRVNLLGWVTQYVSLAPNNPACSRFAQRPEPAEITSPTTGES